MVMKLLIAVITLVIAATIVSSEDANEVVMIDVILSANETKARQGLDMDYSKHAKSSVGGEHDPGYGQASETRTDDQREFEKSTLPRINNGSDPINPSPGTAAHNAMTREVDAEIQEMSDQQVKAGQETAKDADTITLIHRQASTIKRKFKRAKKMIKAERKAAKKAAKKAKEKDQEEEENTPQGIQKVEIDAEQDKIRQEELKNGVDTAAMSTWIDPSAKIDIAPTKNWVRPGRGKKEKNRRRKRRHSLKNEQRSQFCVAWTHGFSNILSICVLHSFCQLGTFKSALHEWNYTPLSDKGVTKGMNDSAILF